MYFKGNTVSSNAGEKNVVLTACCYSQLYNLFITILPLSNKIGILSSALRTYTPVYTHLYTQLSTDASTDNRDNMLLEDVKQFGGLVPDVAGGES